MPRSKKQLEYEDRFYKWLIEDRRISQKVAKNIISRCKRVETMFSIKIIDFYNVNKIDELYEMLRTCVYSKNINAKKSIYALHSTLRYAVKKYLDFLDFDRKDN